MLRNSFLLISILFFLGQLSAQMQVKPGQLASIQTLVEGYNRQDFKQMKKPWGLLGKILIRKKSLKKQYAPEFDKYGKVKLECISCASLYTCTALLSYEKDDFKRGYWQFIFNDHNKLQGYGNAYPLLAYPKKQINKTKQLNSIQKAEMIDSLMKRKYVHKNGFNGCILAKDSDGVLYKNCFGKADYQKQGLLNDSTRFLLASCSKQFTAMAILILAEKNKLNLQDTIGKYIPNFPYRGITIEHLLTHTSGLTDYMPLLSKHWDKSKFANNQDVIELLIKHKPPLLFSPNTNFEYSNTGYVILASIIEKIAQQGYGDFLKEQIFKPLGMHQSMVIARRVSGVVPENYALGYVYQSGPNQYILPDSLKEYDYVTYQDGINGDDGVSASIHDLSIWTNALHASLLISKESLQQAWQPHTLNNGSKVNYGYGFFLERGEGMQPLVYHTGGWPGYTTLIMQFIETGEAVVVLSNNSYDWFLNIADDLTNMLLSK